MRRYWIDARLDENNRLLIVGDAFHHIFEVCRTQPHETFEILGVKPGMAIQVQVEGFSKKQASVRVVGERQISDLPLPRVVLNLCVPRMSILESVVEKAVELGVWRVQLVCNQFSFVRSPKDFSAARYERLKKIIIQGTQQTGRADLMMISPPREWKDWCSEAERINRDPHFMGLMAYESLGGHRSLKFTLRDLLKRQETANQDQSSFFASPLRQEEIWILVGSEGGFSSQEAEDMKRRGWHVVSLGSQILRVETACVVMLASLKYELEHF